MERIQEFNCFQACSKLNTVSVTNIGRVRKREYYVIVDKAVFESMAPRLSDSSESDDDDDTSEEDSAGDLPQLQLNCDATQSSKLDSDSDSSPVNLL